MDHRPFHLPTLDGWRAVAIVLVLLDHAGDNLLRLILPMLGHGIDELGSYRYIKEALGRAGVHLFFGLSGYLITTRLLAEESHERRVDLGRFYRRRILRIQPAALTFLLFAGAAGLAGLLRIDPWGWLSALLSYANFSNHQTWFTGHFWSLSVEEHFYLLWPAAFVFMPARWRLRAAFGIAFALMAWRFVAWKFQWTTGPTFWSRTDIESEWLIWGCIAALLSVDPRRSAWLEKLAAPGVHLVAIPLMVLPVVFVMDWKLHHLLITLAAAAAPLLFVGTVRRPGALLGRFLVRPPVAWLGRISFSLYLWQQIFFVWDSERVPALGGLQQLPLNLVMALLAASASYYLVEQPVIRWGRRTEKRRAVTPEAPVPGELARPESA